MVSLVLLWFALYVSQDSPLSLLIDLLYLLVLQLQRLCGGGSYSGVMHCDSGKEIFNGNGVEDG